MEEFFELLNTGDREGAVALMDEMTEMRIHVRDSAQTLRGRDRVGGWFLRSEKGWDKFDRNERAEPAQSGTIGFDRLPDPAHAAVKTT